MLLLFILYLHFYVGFNPLVAGNIDIWSISIVRGQWINFLEDSEKQFLPLPSAKPLVDSNYQLILLLLESQKQ